MQTKPTEVKWATNLIWSSLAVGFAKVILSWDYLSSHRAGVSVDLLVAFVVIALLAWQIAGGKNWARITFLVLFVIGVLPSVLLVLFDFARSVMVGILGISQLAMQATALILTFANPAKGWFRPGATQPRQNERAVV